MSIVVIGVDPGDSTGVAIITDGVTHAGEAKPVRVPVLFHAFQGKPNDALTLIELTVMRFHDEDVTVACERYTSMRSQRSRTHQPTAQHVVGAVERITTQHERRFELQGPADARAIASSDLLRRLGMLQTGESVDAPDADDANMAVRHALLCLARHHASRFDALLRIA